LSNTCPQAYATRSTVALHGQVSNKPKQYPKELAELSLAHTVGNAVENAYRRSDLFERRRALMQDWAAWCAVVQPDTEETSDAGGEPELEVTDAAEQEGPRSAA
jgi:hypothetical protein